MKHEKGLQLIREQQYLEAYQYFDDAIFKNNNDFDALYYRGIIDFFELRQNIEQTCRDFEKLVLKRTKYEQEVLSFWVIAADSCGDTETVLKYGDKALERKDNLYLDLLFILARTYSQNKTYSSLSKALEYINIGIEEEPNEYADFYTLKCEILISLERYDIVLDLITQMISKFGYNENIYYYKAKAVIESVPEKPNLEEDEKIKINDAILDLHTALQYDENITPINALLMEAYSRLGETDKAIDLLLKLDIDMEPDTLIVEKSRIYERNEQYDDIIKMCIDFLKDHNSWKVEYTLGFFYYSLAKNEEELKAALPYLNHAYEISKEEFILDTLHHVNSLLGLEESNLELFKQILKDRPHEGKWYYWMAVTFHRLNYKHEEVHKWYWLSYTKHNYLTYFDYVHFSMSYMSNPKKYYLYFKKEAIKNLTQYNDNWVRRRIGLNYLYGDYGEKINYQLAGNYLKECVELEPEEQCMLVLYGRYFELTNQFVKAFEYYQKAFNVYEKYYLNNTGIIRHGRLECSCAVGYYAHALIKGIGTKQNIELAKTIILEAIKNHETSVSDAVIVLYAYFYLKGEQRFDGKTAMDYLKLNKPFNRYDLTKTLLLIRVCEKSGERNYQYKQELKTVLKYCSQQDRMFYKQNKKTTTPYPGDGCL